MKEIIEKPGLIKIKNLYSVKDTVKRMRKPDNGLGGNTCKRYTW